MCLYVREKSAVGQQINGTERQLSFPRRRGSDKRKLTAVNLLSFYGRDPRFRGDDDIVHCFKYINPTTSGSDGDHG